MSLNAVLTNLPHLVDDSQNGAASIPCIETVGGFTRASGLIGKRSGYITRYSVRMANIYCKPKVRIKEVIKTSH